VPPRERSRGGILLWVHEMPRKHACAAAKQNFVLPLNSSDILDLELIE
jgi:hypothetical protein